MDLRSTSTISCDPNSEVRYAQSSIYHAPRAFAECMNAEPGAYEILSSFQETITQLSPLCARFGVVHRSEKLHERLLNPKTFYKFGIQKRASVWSHKSVWQRMS